MMPDDASSGYEGLLKLPGNKSVTLEQAPIRGAQGDPTRQAVGSQEAVERIPRPVERKGMSDESEQGRLVDLEARVAHDRLAELGIANPDLPDLREELDLE